MRTNKTTSDEYQDWRERFIQSAYDNHIGIDETSIALAWYFKNLQMAS